MRGQTNKFFKQIFLSGKSRKSKRIKWVKQTNYNFSKIVVRVSQENRNISRRGQTNNFFEQIFRSGKSINSKRINWGRTNKLQFFKNCRSSKSRKSKHISNKFFKQVILSGKSRNSKRIKWG